MQGLALTAISAKRKALYYVDSCKSNWTINVGQGHCDTVTHDQRVC